MIGLSTVICVYVGGQQIIEGKLTTGNIAEFILYVYMLTWPLTALGWTTSQIQRAEASQKRINEFLRVPNDIRSTKHLKNPIKGNITFDKVTFTYPDSGIIALKNFSLNIGVGETVAILGTTGSGKSTLANLLLRMYQIDAGQILIDGLPIESYDTQYLRSQFGYVPQDVFLFSESISHNIQFGSPEMKTEDILQASKDADLYNNIIHFEKSFDTEIGERGVMLSGGQKQRLSIARAIAREPKILILDDSLSAVDTHTENIILGNLERIKKGRTSIIISHRISSTKLADKILVLSEGETIEQGTHTELMQKDGFYRELYEKQLQGEETQ